MKRIENLEILLSSDNSNGSIIELDNFIGELCSYGDDLDKITEPQKLFYFNQCLEREVNNGGFYLYFLNSSGAFAHQTVQSLLTIGANTTADILQKAIDQFPEKKVVQNRFERYVILEEIKDNADPVWDTLNQKFFEYADNLNTLNLNYVRLHKDKF